jgi:hypothetical protein
VSSALETFDEGRRMQLTATRTQVCSLRARKGGIPWSLYYICIYIYVYIYMLSPILGAGVLDGSDDTPDRFRPDTCLLQPQILFLDFSFGFVRLFPGCMASPRRPDEAARESCPVSQLYMRVIK